MSDGCLLQQLGVPSSWRRPAAWFTILLCLLPLSVGWLYGLAVACVLAAQHVRSTFTGNRPFEAIIDGLGLSFASLAGLACAGLGLAALWRCFLSRALGRRSMAQLTPWQLWGLRLGVLSSVFLLVLFVAEPRWDPRTLLPVLLLTWPVVLAICLTRESRQWLFIPRSAR